MQPSDEKAHFNKPKDDISQPQTKRIRFQVAPANQAPAVSAVEGPVPSNINAQLELQQGATVLMTEAAGLHDGGGMITEVLMLDFSPSSCTVTNLPIYPPLQATGSSIRVPCRTAALRCMTCRISRQDFA